MAVECGVAILTKIGEYLVSPIAHHLRYLWHYNKNIEDFQNQVEILGHMRDRVQQYVNVARRNGEEIFVDVVYWLTKVDEIIAQAEELNERINANKMCLNGWCPDWSSMYKLSREVVEQALIVMQLQGDVPGENVALLAPPLCVDLASNRDFVTTESSKSTMDQIMELLQDDECDIIGVYGMGGVGKTTLVIEVGKKAKEQMLFDHVVIAVVSQNSNFRDIQGRISDLLGLKLGEETEYGRAGRLYARLKNENRILIILDDVWAKIDLGKIGIPCGPDHKGCKVILTTRRERVCADMGTKRIRMSPLSPEESWNLFRENAGAIVDSSMLNDVAKKVAKECCGLPLSLVTVGRALHDKELEEWKSALEQLKETIPLTMDEEEPEVFSCIKLSYDYIKTYETKLLFLLCCLFPEDYEIGIEDLARFGMGKGLFENNDTVDKARFTAHQRIRYLKESCLLLDGRWKWSVKMHDVVRDVAISIASKDKNISFLVRDGLRLKVWPNMQTFEHYTAISLMQNDIKKLPGGLECPNLQILLLGKNYGLEEIPDAFFQGMPELRVLDLSCSKTLTLALPPSFELLAQLRTLRLDGCKLDSNISVFGKLKKLEILSLTYTDIKELPKEIGELSNLRLLDLTMCNHLQFIPPNVISRLTKLEELYMRGRFEEWAVEGTEEEKSKACLSELKSLPHLLILSVAVKNIECYPRQLLLQNLVKFDVSTGAGSTQLYPTSRRLAVGHIKTALSDGLKVLLKSAEVFDLTEDSMSEIFDVHGGGPIGLKELRLSFCDNMLSLLNSKSSVIFTSLETLNLEYMASMSFICDSYASFTNLRELSIKRCESLKYLFPYSVAESLLQLKSVWIESCGKLERIIEEDVEEGASSSRRLQPTIVFPNLEIVQLNDCPSLTSLFPVATEKEIMLSKLKRLTIYRCEKLERIIVEDAEEGASSSRLQRIIVFPNLEFVHLKNCPLLTSLFPVATEKEIMLPKLKRLWIESCEKLERIIEDAEEGASSSRLQPIIVFPTLEIVELDDCPSLTSLFPVAKEKEIMLPKLKSLTIYLCEKLERIIEEDVEEGASSSRLQPIIVFPNLEVVKLENCPLLTSLFPVATEEEITLPKLKYLHLKKLRSLKRVCSETLSVDMACLEELVVKKCPMMEFGNDLPAYGLRSAPELKTLEVDGFILDGVAIQNLFSGKFAK